MDNLIPQIYEFARHYHAQDNSGHDFNHINRVYKNICYFLNDYPDADSFILKASALLHDVDDRKLGSDGHQAEKFLNSLNIPPKTVQTILATIDAISFAKTGTSPQFDTIEKKLLYDADKLDAMGAIGICRAILFGSYAKRPLFDEHIFPLKNLNQDEYKNLDRETNTSINHLFDKLLKLKNLMQTEAGKKEAQKRHQFMIDFLKEFFEEQNCTPWLTLLKEQEKS